MTKILCLGVTFVSAAHYYFAIKTTILSYSLCLTHFVLGVTVSPSPIVTSRRNVMFGSCSLPDNVSKYAHTAADKFLKYILLISTI